MITIKEEFLSSVKTKRALKLGGSDSVVLWLALKTYVSAHNTGGFIPEDVIPELDGVPKRWRKALEALLGCGKTNQDGSRGAGLLDRAPHGYQLHDYEDHGTPVEIEEKRRKKARDQKRARRLLLAHNEGRCPDDCTHCVRGQSADNEPDIDSDSTPDGTRARVGTGVAAGAPDRDPQPNPTQPRSKSGQAAAEDLTAEAPAEPEQRPPQSQARIPCPEDLRLTDGQRRTLETAMVESWAIDVLTSRFVAKATADPSDLRTLTAWRKCLSQAISGDWNDPRKRPKRGRESEQFTADDAIARADYLRSIGQ